MAVATPKSATRPSAAGAGEVADALVVFGITGDLAKVMTFRSLYRLERRGLLTCPIVGVAVSDWSEDDLREVREGDRGTDLAVMQPLLDNPPPVHPYAKGSWGPDSANQLVAEFGGWHGPWTDS